MTTATPHAVVIGAGIGGLGAALALSRSGHQVTLLERDHTPMPADPDGAFDWERHGAPQVRHSHALLARLRLLLRDRFPDVLDAMHEAGVEDRPMLVDLPDTLDDPTPQPGDEDLVILAGRRTTFEWVLRRCVLAEPGVRLLDGVAVEGLLADGTPGDDLRVTGVRITGPEGPGELHADLVVAANGRRSDIPGWAEGIGVTIDEHVDESGITYLSRFYRRKPGTTRPAGSGFGTADLGYVKAGLFPCDGNTISVTLAVPVDDRELRKLLSDPETFERGCRALDTLEPWLDPDEIEPMGGVEFMAGLINRTRQFLDDGGRPLLPGFHAVGDAHTCTNPLYGRGCSLAMVMAVALADVAVDHPDDLVARAVAYEAVVEREVAPWYRAALMQDQMAKATGTEMKPGGQLGPTFAKAMRTDATLLRAFVRMLNLLSTPDALIGNPELLARMQAAADRDVEIERFGPDSREEFLALL